MGRKAFYRIYGTYTSLEAFFIEISACFAEYKGQILHINNCHGVTRLSFIEYTGLILYLKRFHGDTGLFCRI